MRHSRRIALILAAACIGVWAGRTLAPPDARRDAAATSGSPAASRAPEIAARAAAESAREGRTRSPAVRAPNPLRGSEAHSEVTPRDAASGAKARGSREPVIADPAATRALPPPALDPVQVTTGAITASVSGWDPAAPRRLALWRVEGGKPARLAETMSEPGGHFQFAQVALGPRELVVGAGRAVPDLHAPRVVLPVVEMAPPVVQVIPDPGGVARLRIWPSARAATIVFAAGGREIARRAVASSPDPRDRMLDVPLLPGTRGATLDIAEERSGGARSPWIRVDAAAPEGGSGAPLDP